MLSYDDELNPKKSRRKALLTEMSGPEPSAGVDAPMRASASAGPLPPSAVPQSAVPPKGPGVPSVGPLLPPGVEIPTPEPLPGDIRTPPGWQGSPQPPIYQQPAPGDIRPPGWQGSPQPPIYSPPPDRVDWHLPPQPAEYPELGAWHPGLGPLPPPGAQDDRSLFPVPWPRPRR